MSTHERKRPPEPPRAAEQIDGREGARCTEPAPLEGLGARSPPPCAPTLSWRTGDHADRHPAGPAPGPVVVERRPPPAGRDAAGVLAEATHEANNLLQAITAEARLLASRSTQEADRTLLERIVEQAITAGQAVARLSLCGQPVEPLRLLPVTLLIDGALRMVDARAKRSQVLLEREVDPALQVLARAPQLEHAVVNLLVNGIQAFDASGDARGEEAGSRRVRIVARGGAPGRVRLAVRDNGPGVAQAIRPLLFDVRVTSKPPSEGSGLGLLLVRRIAEEHGGAVTIHSSPGEYTEAVLDLPAAAVVTGRDRSART